MQTRRWSPQFAGSLDGLALAIEIAATRMDVFGVADIAAMLEDRFRVLRQTRRDTLARHTSLSATLDWSYGMLGWISGHFSIGSRPSRAGSPLKTPLQWLATMFSPEQP
ncbi:MAG: hypothetical protein WDN49_05790 [Acetobacteraceae bacterium]